jgi:hypothetical protein
MMKKLSILVFALLCVATVSAQHQRRVLIEEFTNASCPPCAAQNPAFNAVVAANIQYLTPIKYQTNWPGADPMNAQTQSDVGPRVAYYGVSGVPNGRQNGILEVFPLTSYTATMIQNAYNTLTPVTMNLSHTISPNYDSIYIQLSVTSDSALTGNLRLRVAVTEDEIIFEAPPGTNGEADFYQVMRKMLPNAMGTATGDFAAGETKTYSFAWKLANIYNLNQLSAMAFLQNDDTKEVWQSERTDPIGGIPTVNAKVPGGFFFTCTQGSSPSFTLVNTSDTETLTEVALQYRVGTTGAWTDLNWTGELAAGEAEEIVLSDISINTSGATTIQVAVRSSNLGIQTNMVDPISTITVRALLDASQALPFGNTFQSAVFPPTGWFSVNVGNNGWKLATNAGAGSTRSARCNMFDISAGNKAYLYTPKVDLSTTNAPSTLRFDHAYAYYNASFYDFMRVEASTDCGETWETLFLKGKDDLATAPAVTSAFVPTSSQWAANEIDITNYNGQSEVVFRFVGESGYGNNLFVDNVNVSTSVGVKELTLSTFSLAPNPSRDQTLVRFGIESAQDITLEVYSAEGIRVQTQSLGTLPSGEHRVALNAANMPAGSYRVVLRSNEGIAQTQWIVLK